MLINALTTKHVLTCS